MKPNSHLETVSEVIDALGGLQGMKAIFGGGLTRFCNYRASGCFPASMHMRIYCECLKRGLNIALGLVGMTPDVMALARGEWQRPLPLAAE